MKRCPQCEFIYEDDQSLCDMDGILLVFDTQILPNPNENLTNPTKSHWRGRIVPLLAALVLATVLYLVYYVSTHQQSIQQKYSPASNTAVQPAPDNNIAPKPERSSNESANAPAEKKSIAPIAEAKIKEEKAKTTPASTAKTAKESEKPKVKATQKTQSSVQSPKDDSKISSLLKRTGRILKKPFKL